MAPDKVRDKIRTVRNNNSHTTEVQDSDRIAMTEDGTDYDSATVMGQMAR